MRRPKSPVRQRFSSRSVTRAFRSGMSVCRFVISGPGFPILVAGLAGARAPPTMPRKPYGLDDSLRLRKYRDSGKKLWEIIDSDPDYVLWAIENVDGFEIDNEAFERLRETVPYHPYFRS